MDPQIVVRGRGDFTRLYGEMGRAESRFARWGSRVKTGLVTAGLVGGTALVKLGVDAVSAASDAQQSLGATEAVFGKYADTVIKRSEEAAEALGLSATEYRELSNVTGAMLASAGTPLRKVAELTDDLNERAADMAATFGGTTREAVEAISSLLRGETDPIERYGVAIKQSDINARLAAKGLEDLEGKSLKQAEQTARLELLFRQTASSAGQFGDEADTLAGQQQRLSAEWDNLQASIGEKFLPVATDAIEWIRSDAIPALGDWGEKIRDAASGKSGDNSVGGDVLEAMVKGGQDALDMLEVVWGGIARGWDSLTDKVEDALEEHGPMVRQIIEALSDAASTAMDILGPALAWLAEEGFELLGEGIANALDNIKLAGNVFFDVADIILLTTGSMTETVTGWAAGLIDQFANVAEAAALLDPSGNWDEVAEGLNRMSAKTEDFGHRFKFASDVIRRGLEEQQWEWNLTEREAAKLESRIRLLPDDVETAIRTPGMVKTLDDVKGLRRAYDLSPDEVITVIEAKKLKLTMAEVRQLNRQYDLTPKQVGTLVHQTGAKTTIGELKKVLAQAEITSRQDVKMVLRTLGVDLSVKEFKKVEDEGRRLSSFESEPKVSVDPTDSMAKMERIRRTLVDIDGTHAYTYIHTVEITEQRDGGGGGNDGDNDRKTTPRQRGRETGLELAVGIEAGLLARADAQRRAGQSVLERILSGVTKGTEGVGDALERVTELIRKEIDLKDDKKERAREKRILKNLSDQYDALRKNGRAQDEVNRKLEKAREHLEDVRDWANQVRDSFIETGNVTDLGQLEDGTVSGELLLDQLRDRVENARRFAALIRELSDDVGPALNDTALQQLLDRGPEAGLAAAEALAAGGDAAIDELNALTGELADIGASLGRDMSDEFFKVGLSAAEGLVKGLERRQKQLDRVAERLADRLIDKIRQALDIHSPSRAFQQIGLESVRGLALGLDETYVKRAGARTAAALLSGFGDPTLSADVWSSGRTGTETVAVDLRLSSDELSALEQGKRYVSRSTAAKAVGTRTLAITVGGGRG